MNHAQRAFAALSSALLLLLPGCDSIPAVPTAQTASPEIVFAANDPIQTVEAYMQAVENAREHLPADLTEAYGKKRLALYAREFARLPSAASSHFAAEFIATLRREGIPVNAKPPTGGTPTIRYEELAKVQALTICLMSPTADDRFTENPPKEREKIPYLTWVHVVATVVRASPCVSFTASVPSDVRTPDLNTPSGARATLDLLKDPYREGRLLAPCPADARRPGDVRRARRMGLPAVFHGQQSRCR